MTVALRHATAGHAPCWVVRLVRGVRTRLAAFHHHWFVERVGPAGDPLAEFSARDWSDLPTWHPASDEE